MAGAIVAIVVLVFLIILFARTIRIDCHCADCNKGGQFVPSVARNFLQVHKGHKTKTTKLR